MKNKIIIYCGIVILPFILCIYFHNLTLSSFSAYYKIGENKNVDNALKNLGLEVKNNCILRYNQKGYYFNLIVVDDEIKSYRFSVTENGSSGSELYVYLKSKGKWTYVIGIPVTIILLIINFIFLLKSFIKKVN